MRSLTRTTRRHKVIAVSAACLLVPLAACTPDDGPRPAASATSTGAAAPYAPKNDGKRDGRSDERLDRATIPELQEDMKGKRLTSKELTQAYLDRIHRLNPRLNAVVTVNPDALDLARKSDELRRTGEVRGPLEGIPVLIKDNIDTADRQPTTAGSTALSHSSRRRTPSW